MTLKARLIAAQEMALCLVRLNVSPRLSSTDGRNCSLQDTVFPRQRRLITRIMQYFADIIFIEFGISVLGPNGERPMSVGIRHIVYTISPIKIIGPVISKVAVLVTAQPLRFCRLTIKRYANKAVDTYLSALATTANIDNKSSIAPLNKRERSNLPTCPWGDTHNSPKARCSVFWNSWDWPPFFDGVLKVSHEAVLSLCGQGRALLTQRYRPVFVSRTLSILKGKAVA
jgi:hypothetical protein